MKTPRVLLIGLVVLCGVAAQADVNVIKKDGTKAAAKNLRRQGDNIIVTMELPPEKPGDPVKTGDIGFAYGAGVDFGLNPSQTFRLGLGFRGVYGLFDISDDSGSLSNDSFFVLEKTHVKTYSGYLGFSLLF